MHVIEEESNENTDQRVIDVLSESMGDTIFIQNIDRTIDWKKAKREIETSNCKVCTLQHQERIF